MWVLTSGRTLYRIWRPKAEITDKKPEIVFCGSRTLHPMVVRISFDTETASSDRSV